MKPQNALAELQRANRAYGACETGDPDDHQRLASDINAATDMFNAVTLNAAWNLEDTRDAQHAAGSTATDMCDDVATDDDGDAR